MFIVIDTNILVSALLTPSGAPAQIVSLVLRGALRPCYDYRMMDEYRDVLSRPKFSFDPLWVRQFLDGLADSGVQVVANPLSTPFADEDDKPFYEVAKYCSARLITGNTKHFPVEPMVMTAAQFLAEYVKMGTNDNLPS